MSDNKTISSLFLNLTFSDSPNKLKNLVKLFDN